MKHQAAFETNVSEMLIHSLYNTKKKTLLRNINQPSSGLLG